MTNESELIIGGQSGNLSKYNINTPTAPQLIKNIQLSNDGKRILRSVKTYYYVGNIMDTYI